MSGLGREGTSIYFPVLHTHMHAHSWHAQNQGTAMAPEPTPGCVTTHSPSNWTSVALLLLAQDTGQASPWLCWMGSPIRPKKKGWGTTHLKLPPDPPLFPFHRMGKLRPRAQE